MARLGLGQAGVVDAPLPKASVDITPYAKLGNITLLVLIVSLVAMALVGRVMERE